MAISVGPVSPFSEATFPEGVPINAPSQPLQETDTSGKPNSGKTSASEWISAGKEIAGTLNEILKKSKKTSVQPTPSDEKAPSGGVALSGDDAFVKMFMKQFV